MSCFFSMIFTFHSYCICLTDMGVFWCNFFCKGIPPSIRPIPLPAYSAEGEGAKLCDK